MKHSILGFDQHKVTQINKTVERNGKTVNLKLDSDDLLLLRWFLDYFAFNPKKFILDNKCYMWVDYNKILEDLPILNISKQMLHIKFDKLKDLELIESKQYQNIRNGSMKLITPTQLLSNLVCDTTELKQDITQGEEEYLINNSKQSATIKNYSCDELATIKNYNSNNILLNNKSLHTYNSKELSICNNAETSSATKKSNIILEKKVSKDIKKNSMINSKIKYIVENTTLKNQLIINTYKKWLDVLYETKGFNPTNIQIDLSVKQLLDYLDKYGETKTIEIMNSTIQNGYKDFSYAAPKDYKSTNIKRDEYYQNFGGKCKVSIEQHKDNIRKIKTEGTSY